MKISAVIPAYNAEKYIARAIKSVLQQTRPADEIIVVDDGSADKTAEIVRGFGNKVILIEQKNAG
ncbi:MAG: glycosyltransferase family 2 protein, partial [Planctomycetota bacterium]